MKTCPSCSADAADTASFCTRCGASLTAAQPVAPRPPAAAARPAPRPQSSGAPVALIVSLIVGGFLVLIAVVGILAAIAIPNFIKYQGRSKQSEAKFSLGSIRSAARAFEAAKDVPPETFADMQFAPAGQRRYAYFWGADAMQPTLGGPYELPSDLPEDTEAVAVGNIDSDPTLDVWVLDSSGAVTNLVNDADK